MIQRLMPGVLVAGLEDVASRVRESVVTVQSGTGWGAGTAWPGDGLIVTNAHVAGAARSVVVITNDGRRLAGDVVAFDGPSDLAVIRVESGAVPPVVVGDPTELRPGELVMAVGTPFGQAGSVALGTVASALTSLPARRRLIRSDVRLAPGNSGGPLVDAYGRVVGINAMVWGGLSLSIPADDVASFVRASGTAAAA